MAFKRPAQTRGLAASAQEVADREEFLRAILGQPPRSSAVDNDLEQTRAHELREFLHDILTPEAFFIREGAWDPSKHPRLGADPNAGWFADKGTGSTSTGGNAPNTDSTNQPDPEDEGRSKFQLTSTKGGRDKSRTGSKSGANKSSAGAASGPLPHEQTDPANWYLPSDDRGTWSGVKGDSKLLLKSPVEAGGKMVREIHYQGGLPVLDHLALPGNTATIVLTGDSKADIANAKIAWQKLNPGKQIPGDSVFHHDLLHVTEVSTTINGKKTKVLVGKMHLIPSDAHRIVYHEGSASIARKFYQGLDVDISLIKQLAKEQVDLVTDASSLVARGTLSIKPGAVPKRLRRLIGRNVIRAIPLVGTGLAIFEFTDNVEAHGLGGAAARATPILGDLISAHDLGSELAKGIVDDANNSADDTYRKNQGIIDEAWQKASAETIQSYQELSQKITVTNAGSHLPRLVDPHEVADALDSHRNKMQSAIHLELERGGNMISSLARKSAKEELRIRLTKAAQKHAPRKRLGPII